MFTGIVEEIGIVDSVSRQGRNLQFSIRARMSRRLKIGQSISHNGACLTVVSKNSALHSYTVTAVPETLRLTNLGGLKKGSSVNLERALKIGDRLDGHFVQGHVDGMAVVSGIRRLKGSHEFSFRMKGIKKSFAHLLAPKGSICINGVSLTLVNIRRGKYPAFSVAIIPHTFRHTNFRHLKLNDRVNIEFDMLGKYLRGK